MKGKRILFVFALAVVLVFAMTAIALAASFDITWDGIKGADNNQPGADLHWVVSGGGDATAYAAITDASILITYSDDTTATFPLLKVAGAEMQFDTTGVDELTVKSAVVTYEAPSQLAEDAELKISHINVEETTTSEEVTTTEVGEETTVPGETTTEAPTTTTQADLTTANSIATGGGGTSGGPGAGTWALGILALALAGGLGWTAVRPALKRK